MVQRFASQIVESARGKPILDLACGSGRNALTLARLDSHVICADIDLSRLGTLPRNEITLRMQARQINFAADPWPFEIGSLGGIMNVHFMLPSLFAHFADSITSGGILLIETVPGCGGNYVQLPKAGELSSAFQQKFDFLFYKERKVGPRSSDAVVVRMVGKRKGI